MVHLIETEPPLYSRGGGGDAILFFGVLGCGEGVLVRG